MVRIMNGGGYPREWKLMDEEGPSGQGQAPAFDMERARLLHQHQLGENQCTSALVKHINAPLDVVSLDLLLLIIDHGSLKFSVNLSHFAILFPFLTN